MRVTLGWALEHRVFMLLVTLATIVLTVRLYTVVPKGFLPLQDTGILIGSTQASPDVSFQAMEERQRAVVDVVLRRPRGGQRRLARSACRTAGARSIAAVSRSSLKPLSERGISSEEVIARLRGPLEKVGGVQTTLFSAQDLRGGGRQGGSQYPVRGHRAGRERAAPLGAGAGGEAARPRRASSMSPPTRIAPARRSTW